MLGLIFLSEPPLAQFSIKMEEWLEDFVRRPPTKGELPKL